MAREKWEIPWGWGIVAPILFLLPFAALTWGLASIDRARREAPQDYVLLGTDGNGRPLRCWQLRGVAAGYVYLDDWHASWTDPRTGNAIRLAGRFSHVRVVGGDWQMAFRTLGITAEQCAALERGTYDPGTRRYEPPEVR